MYRRSVSASPDPAPGTNASSNPVCAASQSLNPAGGTYSSHLNSIPESGVDNPYAYGQIPLSANIGNSSTSMGLGTSMTLANTHQSCGSAQNGAIPAGGHLPVAQMVADPVAAIRTRNTSSPHAVHSQGSRHTGIARSLTTYTGKSLPQTHPYSLAHQARKTDSQTSILSAVSHTATVRSQGSLRSLQKSPEEFPFVGNIPVGLDSLGSLHMSGALNGGEAGDDITRAHSPSLSKSYGSDKSTSLRLDSDVLIHSTAGALGSSGDLIAPSTSRGDDLLLGGESSMLNFEDDQVVSL